MRGERTEAPAAAPVAEPAAVRPAALATPDPARPTPPPARAAVRRKRSEPPAYVEEPRLPEVEPLPPAYEEDENEEIGRPEGPLEERHVDPYAVEEEPEGRAAATSRRERGSGRSVEPGFKLPAQSEPEDEWPAALETEDDEPGGTEYKAPLAEPARADELEPELEPETELGSGNASEESGGPEWTPSDEGGATPAPARDEPRFGRRPGRTKRGR